MLVIFHLGWDSSEISNVRIVQVGTATEMGIATTVVETTDVAKQRFTPEVKIVSTRF